jgi:hypothetical protein
MGKWRRFECEQINEKQLTDIYRCAEEVAKIRYDGNRVSLNSAFMSRDGVLVIDTSTDVGLFIESTVRRIFEREKITIKNETERFI